jgi:hypothetical protein
MRAFPSSSALCVFLPLTVACSANLAAATDAVDADSTSGATSAVVVVERTVGVGDARASAVARFVRMRAGAVDEDALRLVGATVDFPALGTCLTAPGAARATTVAAGPSPSPNPRAVELLDVGAMSLEANGLRTSLQARQIPDVVDLLSGVVYATPAADADALPARSVYVLRAAGSLELDVAPFAVSASAPDEPMNVRISGQDAGPDNGGPVQLPRQLSGQLPSALANDASIEVSWDAGSSDDFVYFDVSGEPGAQVEAQASARCLFSDVGQAALTSSAFGDTTSGTITIHRLHREPFRVKGVDSGEVRFDFARVVAFSRL